MKISKKQFEKILIEEIDTYLQKEETSHEARELEVYITSNPDLYRQQHQPIIKNLITKKARGVYDSEKAVKLFMYLVANGAKKYAQEHGGGGAIGPSVGGFDKATRMEVARTLTQAFEDEAELGNYDNMLPKKYQKEERVRQSNQPSGLGENYKDQGARDIVDYYINALNKRIDPSMLLKMVLQEIGYETAADALQKIAEDFEIHASPDDVDDFLDDYLQEGASDSVWELYETLLEAMGAEALLGELMQAMSSQEAQENLEHIAQMHDIATGVGEYMKEGASDSVWELYETLLEAMGPELLLGELMQAMSSQEAQENLEHIAQMHDIATGVGEYMEEELPPGRKEQPIKEQKNPWTVAWNNYKKSKK